jgi:hypothetical protein
MLTAATALLGAAGAARARTRAFDPRDLSGMWDSATYTLLQRPKELPRLVLTPAEADAYEAPRRKLHGFLPAAEGEVGQNESEFPDRGSGLLRVKGEIRASMIVEPADGQLPYTAAAKKLQIAGREIVTLDNPEERGIYERCLTTPSSGAPMIPAQDANVLQFLQTKDALAIVCEKFHDVRIIPLGAGAKTEAAARPVPSWLGTSVGRWSGDTLVVETTGLRPGVTPRDRFWLSGEARITETFTRTGAGEILYGFTVDDPGLYTRPWRGELAFKPASGLIYEYACHEGNYGLPDILRAARRAEAAAAK